jgi:hypothetical protein
MGLSGMVLSAISAVTGAIMYWATTAQTSVVAQQHGFRLSTLGVILMIAGAVGFVISFPFGASAFHGPRGRRQFGQPHGGPRASELTRSRRREPLKKGRGYYVERSSLVV